MVDVRVASEAARIRQLESVISELSVENRVFREQVKIYEERGEEAKKNLSMKQLAELERLKQEVEALDL
jgi:hypothetical protein